jgi:hypothetical protein
MAVPAQDLGYDVRVLCPEKHWDEFWPAAQRIVESVKFL